MREKEREVQLAHIESSRRTLCQIEVSFERETTRGKIMLTVHSNPFLPTRASVPSQSNAATLLGGSGLRITVYSLLPGGKQ